MKILFRTIIVLGLIGLGSLAWWGKDDFKKGQTFTREALRYPIIFTDRNGVEIHRIFGNENREWAEYNDIPELLKTATLLAEDRRFFYHFGIDFYGLVRASWVNVMSGRFEQGASTLTQQIARKTFLSDEKTIHRKLREMFLAMGMEYRYTKEELLEIYLNTVPYGARTNGVKVAADLYFKKEPDELSEAEILVLTMLPQNPVLLSRNGRVKNWLGNCTINQDENCTIFSEDYSPTRIESILLTLANKEGWDKKKVQAVWSELKTIRLPRNKNWAYSDYQHFQFYVRDFLAKHGAQFSSVRDGIIVQTSLDAELQSQIYQQLRDEHSGELLQNHDIENFATIILDHETRSPLVWIGSKYYWNQAISGQIDMLRSPRQTGSTIKPFIYASAIDEGYQPPTILYDSTIKFKGDNHVLRNSDGHYLGGIRMTEALATSRNIPAAKAMLLGGGEKKVRSYLDKTFGFRINRNNPHHAFGWTLSLGTAPTKIQTLANAYATLATGKKQDLCPILSIKTFQGEDLGNFCNKVFEKTVDDNTRFFVNDMLSNVAARPKVYNWRKNLTVENFNMAVKTGTSSKRVDGSLAPADNLVVGYSPNHTILMWAGNTDGSAFKPGSVAVTTIGHIWNEVAQTFYSKNPTTYASFGLPTELQRIHGEWATLDYKAPSYNQLERFVWYNREQGLNPLNELKNRPIKN